jgi:hypothetical protein
MCSGSGGVESTQNDLMNAQANMVKTLNADYGLTFAQQQNVLNQQVNRLNNIYSNPQGFTPQELAQATTSINENAATAGKAAAGAAAAAAARGGATDVGSGAGAMLASSVYPAIAAGKASALSNLKTQDAALKRQMQWQALSGLGEAGSQYGSAGSTAAGSSADVAKSSTGAGQLALQAGQTNFNDILGGLQAAGGLAMTGANIAGGAPATVAPTGTTPTNY